MGLWHLLQLSLEYLTHQQLWRFTDRDPGKGWQPKYVTQALQQILGVQSKNLCDFSAITIQPKLVMQLHLCLQQIWQEHLITWNTPSWKAIFLLSPRHSCNLQSHSRYTLLSLKVKLGMMWVHSPQLWNETALTHKMPQQETSAQWTPWFLFDQEIMISPGGAWHKFTSHSHPLAGVITACLLSPAHTQP